VLVVSEELDELFELSDRLHVIAKGRLSPSVPVAEATIELIGEWMSGLWHGEVQAHLRGRRTGRGEGSHAAA
jgi:ABC-type sugar transport system ATPase subunit